MNGLIRNSLVGIALGTGVLSSGCCRGIYRDLVDPCWPERYNAQARKSTQEIFDAQAANGHVLDQTVWNRHFDADPKTGAPTDKLSVAGMDHLKYLSRRKPSPDPRIFLQTAQEVPGGAAAPLDKFAAARAELDTKRAAAVQAYLAAITSGREQTVAYQVVVHDPADVGIPAIPIAGSQRTLPVQGSIPRLHSNFQGVLPETTGPGGASGGGGSGGGASSGGGSAGGS